MGQLDLLTPQFEQLIPNTLVSCPGFLGQRSIGGIFCTDLVDSSFDLVELSSQLDGPTVQSERLATKLGNPLIRLLLHLLLQSLME